ncbi:hypothetical protein A2635_00680 [Candidatus Peribacteria bacterium RIFCSPHIGHO2_01_FULL_51_9]|nr:MAG: hypothetical protein A2635_00680 [Candidatus Peribacteria bacterium RIFCSPHIGHO2_01_FULL_51_9]
MASDGSDTHYIKDPTASDEVLHDLRSQFKEQYPTPEDYVQSCYYKDAQDLDIAGLNFRDLATHFGIEGDPIESVITRDAVAARIYQIGMQKMKYIRDVLREKQNDEWDKLNDSSPLDY